MRSSNPDVQSPGVDAYLRIVHCREFSTKSVERDLIVRADGTLDVYKEIEKSGYLSFEISSEGVKVRAGQFVGLVPINARLAVRVVPRIPLRNLTRILTQLGLDLRQVQALRHYGESPTLSGWMMNVLTDAFLHSLEGLRDKGIQRQYIERRQTSSFPHGRIRLSETARLAAAGQKHRTVVSWFERTPQSPYNQILKAAIWLCLTEYSTPEQRYLADNRRRVRLLSSALGAFENVVLPENHEIPTLVEQIQKMPIPTTLDHYHQPLGIGARLLRGKGIDLESDAGAALRTSLLVDMGKLFEKYVRTSLQDAAIANDWPLVVLDGNLDDAKVPMYEEIGPVDLALAPDRTSPVSAGGMTTAMTPDIVIKRDDGKTLLVADVKNKLSIEMPKREDAEQVIAYAVRYGVSKALIVYPKNYGQTAGMQAVGTVGPISIFQYHYDLDTAELEGSKAQFADAVRRLLASG